MPGGKCGCGSKSVSSTTTIKPQNEDNMTHQSIIQRISSVFERNSNSDSMRKVKLELLEQQRKEHELNRSLHVASSPEIRDITNQIEENCRAIQKLLSQNEILWNSRNSFVDEKNEEFDKQNEFPQAEYDLLKNWELNMQKKEIEDQLKRQMNTAKGKFPKYMRDAWDKV